MKRLILLRGPMGVGKTAAGLELQKLLPDCALLDGDWCWNVRPFAVSARSRAAILDNIHHLLGGYLRSDAVRNIVFCWVMQEEEIAAAALSGLPLADVKLHRFSLVASPEALRARILADVERGLRAPDVLARSRNYLAKFDAASPEAIDTTKLAPGQVAREILRRMDCEFRL